MSRRPATSNAIDSRLIRTVLDRLRQGKQVRRSLPDWGRIAIDRQLPFLCVYRRPARVRDPGTDRLATSEAAYLLVSGQPALQPGVTDLVRGVATTMVEAFGAFLVLEIWAGSRRRTDGPASTAELKPGLTVVAPRGSADSPFTDDLAHALGRMRLVGRKAEVASVTRARCAPPGMQPLLSSAETEASGARLYGLEIAPIYRDPHNGAVFPEVLRRFRRALTVALRRAFFEFARTHTTHRPTHFHALGRRAVVRAVWDVDRLLAEASEPFDFLLQVTPVNGDEAWSRFRRGGFQRAPTFHYRPIPAEPVVLKRALYRAPVERIEDPALAMLFREKLDDLDRQVTMLQDRNTGRFLHESIQLYGGVEDDLFDLATTLLERIPPRSREGPKAPPLDAKAFARRAEEEIAHYRREMPAVGATVEVRSDVAGLLVSSGNLLVSAQSRIPAARVEALLQHEVGTHVLTYYNGRAQPLRHLYVGLAGYDALQEGLAVLAEYLVGGLSRPRLRLLAARVLAIRRMVDGASFLDVFRELDRAYDFDRRTAFVVTMRTFRGGGLTKDAVYLRGLRRILEYLGQGGELEPLFVGKIGIQHIPIVRELRWRGVLREPPLVPRYLERADVRERLARLRAGVTVIDLLKARRA